MTTFVLAPTTTWTATDGTTPSAMLAQGHLNAYRERSTGTLRHVALCPVGTPQRATAEWVSEELFAGRSVADVARDLHSSVSVVRRFVLALELTEEIEAGEWDDLHFAADGTPEWAAPSEDAEYAADTAADVPGATCEPTGTTGDDLADALADSLAERAFGYAEAQADSE